MPGVDDDDVGGDGEEELGPDVRVEEVAEEERIEGEGATSRRTFESPKSLSLICPVSEMSTLSGLRSRWTMPCLWRNASAWTISAR